MRSNVLLLLVVLGESAARDPFFPPGAAETCVTAAAALSPSLWRLQGTITQSADSDAWLITAEKRRLRVRRGDSIPGTPWRVKHVDSLSVTLIDDMACQPPFSLKLKGDSHAKDSPVDAVVHPSTLRAGG